MDCTLIRFGSSSLVRVLKFPESKTDEEEFLSENKFLFLDCRPVPLLRSLADHQAFYVSSPESGGRESGLIQLDCIPERHYRLGADNEHDPELN